MIENIAVIGVGIMGSGIAQALAMGDKYVKMYDVSEENLQKAHATINKSLNRFVNAGRITEEEKNHILTRITSTIILEEACQNVELVIEAVPEILQLKKEIFQKLDSYTLPSTILATNTSELSVTAIASVTSRPEKVVGMHWFNPAPVMKLVEIVQGVVTAESTIQAVKAISEEIGKETVVVKDMQGFVTSRAIAIHVLECMRMYEEGIASKEEIDKAIKFGLNYPMGPLELADYVGLDTLLFASKGLMDAFGDRFRAPQTLVKLVEAGHFGRKTGKGFYDYSKGKVGEKI
ncbi:3-hydroxybutyryl-CoA dehydrogenase [Bacillus pseudomycoides]|uniref:3-hydroxybutyryl-CoA dehydrogenase n=1 Tax=Bacillus pseudomycoides TaxID=64104 RepID=A0AA91ZVE3_9BACI|nr:MULTISPECIES: 3-hydroxyacyl-CoA dehydrogenase family protein [Bacillus]PEB51650.1 3-hydroxybutyryl-CoA dehydrogenase [Bacillus sp. AFS098217]PED83618.1 3-hydroxybutyryl-CoA dehydrogenase [Bacillus pseudomycoides]PEU12394.1 3-hydroxybutyryl-CoA dehydrogenase [Bacillus sp. AFS019443]PEU21754.1 3-hydroxybutyryl-CoA dehydrogenase [Bacillus sp. AFS014408]PFW62115.1 3-hydroxybutyryl-CoA dehydrogenase [Bacillus sp. AFS075034]